MKMIKIIVQFFCLGVILAGCNLFPSVTNPNVNQVVNVNQAEVFNFFATGNMVKNNPGLKPDVWYFVYEQPGAPALTVELKFDANTTCIVDQTTVPCAISSADFFQQGEKVSVKGNKSGDFVLVSEVTKQAVVADTGAKTLTLDDNNKTIQLKVGETFLLKLGTFYDWNFTISDKSIVNFSSPGNIPAVSPVPGNEYLKAIRPGGAVLNAVGDPQCRQSKPACGAPSILFKLNIDVTK